MAQEKQAMIGLAQLQASLKERMQKRGGLGIHAVGVAFKNMDDNGNRKLDKFEFSKALAELGIPVNKTELDALMTYYDKDNDGNISFDEFLVGLKSELSPRRMALVQKAFRILDKDLSGEVTVDDVIGRYDAAKHPLVLAGEATTQQILEEFINGMEGFCGKGNRDHKVTLQEFTDYYTGVSSSIDREDYFALMMCQAWHMTE
eukprot:TRINITY_DN17000_c0_g1_i1.p1 TRINITY_DN17000_c0_g1~~TRINITY_DN17000_c0_g1_i1.p1  ORF type:complete len:210 (+),score=77.93 TRINITY_DN17000_c0_g1_i1:22-630(+)